MQAREEAESGSDSVWVGGGARAVSARKTLAGRRAGSAGPWPSRARDFVLNNSAETKKNSRK